MNRKVKLILCLILCVILSGVAFFWTELQDAVRDAWIDESAYQSKNMPDALTQNIDGFVLVDEKEQISTPLEISNLRYGQRTADGLLPVTFSMTGSLGTQSWPKLRVMLSNQTGQVVDHFKLAATEYKHPALLDRSCDVTIYVRVKPGLSQLTIETE